MSSNSSKEASYSFFRCFALILPSFSDNSKTRGGRYVDELRSLPLSAKLFSKLLTFHQL